MVVGLFSRLIYFIAETRHSHQACCKNQASNERCTVKSTTGAVIRFGTGGVIIHRCSGVHCRGCRELFCSFSARVVWGLCSSILMSRSGRLVIRLCCQTYSDSSLSILCGCRVRCTSAVYCCRSRLVRGGIVIIPSGQIIDIRGGFICEEI